MQTIDSEQTAALRLVTGTLLGAALAVSAGALLGHPPAEALALAAPGAVLFVAGAPGLRARLESIGYAVMLTVLALTLRPYPLFGQALCGALVASLLTRTQLDERHPRRREGTKLFVPLAALLGALAFPLAVFAEERIVRSMLLASEHVPALLLHALGGLLAGALLVLTQWQILLSAKEDPVEVLLQKASLFALAEARRGALHQLTLCRAQESERRRIRSGIDEISLACLELKSSEARREQEDLAPRLIELEVRLQETKDEAARQSLERTRALLLEQQEMQTRLRHEGERIAARLEHSRATLVRTDLALQLLASGNAMASGARLDTIADTLARQAREFESEGESLAEIFSQPQA